jgi:hypothetical protein
MSQRRGKSDHHGQDPGGDLGREQERAAGGRAGGKVTHTLLLHCCHSVVTLLLHYCYTLSKILSEDKRDQRKQQEGDTQEQR